MTDQQILDWILSLPSGTRESHIKFAKLIARKLRMPVAFGLAMIHDNLPKPEIQKVANYR